MKKVALVALALAIISCGQQKTAQKHFDEGVQLVQKGEIDKAIACYEQGLKLEPKSALGHNLLGMGCRFKYAQTGDRKWREKEIACFEASLSVDRDYMPALVNLGATYYYAGDKKKAVPYFKHALEIYPNHPEAEMIKKMIAEGEEAE